MSRLRPYRGDLLAALLLLGLALLWFAPVLLPPLFGLTLLPYDNLYAFQPWRALQPGLVPHNELLSDLVLENAVWKLHVRAALADGQIPLCEIDRAGAPDAELVNFGLLPEVQGRGLGGELIRTLLTQQARVGVPGIHLGVATSMDVEVLRRIDGLATSHCNRSVKLGHLTACN